MKTRIQNSRVIDPESGLDCYADIGIAEGKIVGLWPRANGATAFAATNLNTGIPDAGFDADTVLQAEGWIALPALVDAGVTLSSAGQLTSELQAALHGGVGHVLCQPGTQPVLDEPGLVEMLLYRSSHLGLARLHLLGALTNNLKGQALAAMVSLAQAGCVGFSNGKALPPDTRVLERSLQYAATYGYTVWLHPLDPRLGADGVVASGELANRMGLCGVPVAAETIALFTIFELVRSSGARVHISCISSAAGLDLVRQAKAEGLPVSADVSIASLHLSEQDIGHYDSRARLVPPLRNAADRQALRRGLADGSLDALVSDHHALSETTKILPFAESSPGASGIELLLCLTHQWAQEEQVALAQALACVSNKPAALIGETACLRVGAAANLCLFDPECEWQVDANSLISAGRFTPFAFAASGRTMRGRVQATMLDGQLAYLATSTMAEQT